MSTNKWRHNWETIGYATADEWRETYEQVQTENRLKNLMYATMFMVDADIDEPVGFRSGK
jgi:hypothetical protein